MKLTLSLGQIKTATGNPEANLEKSAKLVKQAANQGSNLICFPEMWLTGFNWDNLKGSLSPEEIIARLAKLAKEHSIWINGSLAIRDKKQKTFNTSILFNSRGEIAGSYQKVHLFSLLNEQLHTSPGNHLALVDTPWGRWGLTICYDIRFPELFRSYALKGANLILSPMAFPYPRLAHWKILVRARAIENQMFMLGTNRVGKENLGTEGEVSYFGNSVIIDPWGETIAEASEDREELLTATIEMGEVDKIRAKMTVLRDRRPEVYDL